MPRVIRTENLCKTFQDGETKTYVLDSISMQVNEGEFVAIMGPSGSGKSTLLHVLGLLLPESSGKYFLFDKDITHYTGDELARVRNRDFGFVFQSFHLLAKNTVRENVALPLVYSDVPEKEWYSRVGNAIESVGLSHRIDYPANRLSGGEKQRVAIARALVCSPRVIFADEPTGNLDLKSGEMVMNILKRLNEEKGYTVVLITHEDSAARYAERMVYMEDGKIIKAANISELENMNIKLK